MDGCSLLRGLNQLLSELDTSAWLDPKFSYDCLYDAAIATVDRLNYPTTTEDITTVATTSDYNLDSDYMKLYLMDDENRYFIKYYNTSAYSFIYPSSYDSIILADNTIDVSIPSTFAIVDAADLAQKTGTTTSTGSLANKYVMYDQTLGESTLTDATASFSTVKVGDTVHNVTDMSHGIVVATSTTTAVICSLFGGTNNFFTSGDTYIINPQKRFKLVLDPGSLTSGHTVTLYYVQKPAPIYSYYRRYSLPIGAEGALTHYAAWLYKYRDREVNFGDAWYKFWDISVRKLKNIVSESTHKKGFKVNLIKRAGRSGSYR